MEYVFVNMQINNTDIHKHGKLGVSDRVKKMKGKEISLKMWIIFFHMMNTNMEVLLLLQCVKGFPHSQCEYKHCLCV